MTCNHPLQRRNMEGETLPCARCWDRGDRYCVPVLPDLTIRPEATDPTKIGVRVLIYRRVGRGEQAGWVLDGV